MIRSAPGLAVAAVLLAAVMSGQDRNIPVDNEWVRVVQVHRAQPGVKTRRHLHAINRVMVYLNAGGQTVTYVDSGKVDRQTWRAGEALWSARGGMHVAENPQVRLLRMKLGPGEKTPLIEHGAHRLVTYLSDQDLEVTQENGTPGHWQRKAGQVEWLEAGAVETIRNTGARMAEAIVIYLN